MDSNELITTLIDKGFTRVKEWVRANFDVKGEFKGNEYKFEILPISKLDLVSIEWECNERPSGIQWTDADWYVYQIDDKNWIINIEQLKWKIALGSYRKVTGKILISLTEFQQDSIPLDKWVNNIKEGVNG